MKLKRLKLRGFMGIKKGLGLDEIDVDLSTLSGLVSITGANGKGKTSFLESLFPYRQLASRGGALKNHVSLRDSFKELVFDHNGHEYRTLVKIDAGSDKSEGFIWQDGESLVGGKAREYDKKIVELFGSPELFFSSVFCAQNAAKLSDMTPGEIKGLFAEFLQLDKLAAYEQTAKQAGNTVLTLAEAKSREIDRIANCADIDAVEQGAAEYERKAAEAEAEIEQNEQLLAAAQRDLDEAKKAKAKNAVIEEKIEALRRDIERERKAATERTAAEEQALQDMRDDAQRLINLIETNTALAARAPELAEAEGKKAAAQEEIKFQEEKISDAEEALGDARTQKNRVTDAISEARSALSAATNSPELATLKSQIAARKQAAAVLEKRSTICNDPACPLIAAAVEAAEGLPELEEKAIALEVELARKQETANAEIEAARAEQGLAVERITEAEDDIKKARRLISEMRARIDEAEATLRQRGAIEAAAARCAELQEQLEQVKAAGVKKREALDARKLIDAQAIKTLEDLLYDTRAGIDTAAAEGVLCSQRRIETLQTAQSFARKQAVDLQAKLATARARLDAARQAAESVAALKAELADMKTEAAEWKYLQDACGKNGLQALEIDGTAPAITEYANSILGATYGTAFRVRIQTQDPETGKECFDIIVIADDGSEILLENLSGGQRVWILKALRLAMTLLSKEKSCADFRSAYADEEDGALDPEKARAFVDMYRQFMRSGGFESFFYISHRPECVAMADHTIEFNENGITIN